MASLSEEEENYVRLALILKGMSPRAVRAYFDREFPPTVLPSLLNTNYNLLKDLKLRRIINQAQWNILIPRNGVPDSKTFDVTLMICLIRNLTSINPPINGFDNLPMPNETMPGSDLARIKYYRNKLAHHDSNTIDTAYFNSAWGDISDAVGRLGGQQIYQECQQLKVKILDQSNKEIILEIRLSLEEMRGLRETVDILGTEHSKVTEHLRELEYYHRSLRSEQSKNTDEIQTLKDPIPRTIKEAQIQEVEMWKLEDKKFAETTASSKLFLTVSQQDTNVVTVIGPRGCGKSFLTKHIAIKIEQKYYSKIIPVEGLKKIIEWYDPEFRQLFVLDIDNAFHSSQLDHTLKKWQNQSAKLQSRIDNRSLKMIACCSTDTYENPEFEKISLLHQHKFDLKADENILSDEDIEAIAARHMKEDEVVVIKEIKENLKKLDNFPMLCRKFADEKHENPRQYFAEYMSLVSNDTRVENSNTNVDINTSNSITVNPGQIVQGMFMNSTISNSPMTFNFNINTINKN